MPGDPIDPTQNQLGLHQRVTVSFPLKGIADAWGRETQPPATTPDCLNVMPFDSTLRGRGGKRPGATNTAGGTAYGGVASGTNYIQNITAGTIQSLEYYGGSGTISARHDVVFVFAGGKLYAGSNSTASLGEITASDDTFNATADVSAALIGNRLYFTNGNLFGWMYDAFGTTYADWGYGPFAYGPRIMCAWRNRLVVSNTALDSNPQNVYASRVGDPSDFNYGAGDAASAWVINTTSKGGQVGPPVTALVPLNDNQLLIGCDTSLWLADGDPADGGRVGVLNAGAGIFSNTAWTMSDTGDVYFVGKQGFCMLERGSLGVQNLSNDTYPSFFQGLTTSAYRMILVWDSTRKGCWIFKTPRAVGSATHLWWDGRTLGPFPMQFPALMGPTAASMYDDPVNGRVLLFGAYAGNSGGTNGSKLYTLSDSVLGSDDGTAFTSRATIGPVRMGDGLQQFKLTAADVILGDPPAGVSATNLVATLTMQSGNSAYEAFGTPRATASASLSGAGRQQTNRSRQCATDYFFVISDATSGRTWSLEEIILRFLPAGRVRS